jgi:hypothetical protein
MLTILYTTLRRRPRRRTVKPLPAPMPRMRWH